MHQRRISVFVSSTMAELQYERETSREVIEELSFTPTLFELFPAMSASPRQAYLEAVRDCDVFVLILYRQFSAATMSEYQEAIERNKPIIVLVRLSDSPRQEGVQVLLEELQGKGKPGRAIRTSYRTYGSLHEFRSALRDALLHEITGMFRSPLHTLTREEMYELGAEIVTAAQRRVAIVERTPSLFLGARPYELPQEKKWQHERRFLDSVRAWVNDAVQDEKRTFIYAYSPSDTRQYLAKVAKSTGAMMIDQVRRTVPEYMSLEQETGRRIRFVALRTTFSGPMAVGDNRVAFWLLGAEDAVSLQQENRAIGDVVIRMLNLHAARAPNAETAIRELVGQPGQGTPESNS